MSWAGGSRGTPIVRRLGGLGVALCLVAAAVATPGGGVSAGERRRPDPTVRAQALMNPRRDRLLKPEQVVAALHLEPGQAVADIGAGPGYFALRLARAVGPEGRVYGVDIEPHFIAELERLAGLAGLPNVVPVLTRPDSPGLPSAAVDLAFFCSVYRHVVDRVGYLRELRGCLRPGGRVAILEWRTTDASGGALRPPKAPHPPMAERLAPQQVEEELEEAGFTVLERLEFLEHHYFVIAGRGP